MANEMIEVALASVLEEIERSRKIQEEQRVMLSKMLEKVEEINKRLDSEQPIQEFVDTTSIDLSITKGIARLQKTIEAQPRTVRKEYRILLFPEHGASEYYRLVLGRLLFWLIVILLSTYLFILGKQTVQSWYIIHSQENELNNSKNYIRYLLEKENKKKKK